MIWKIARAGFALGVLLIFPSAPARTAPLLRGVKTVPVDSTVVSNPEKVKEEAAANFVQDSLRNALRSANIELGDSAPIHAHIVLDEFTSGSMAKRLGWDGRGT